MRELLDIGTGHKGFDTATGDHQHTDVPVALGLGERAVQLVDGGAVQRVQLVGTVDGDDADRVGVGDEEVLVAHGSEDQMIRT